MVSLTEPDEMAALGVSDLGQAVAAAGLTWHHLPIPDLAAPSDLKAWEALSPTLHQALDRGGRVLIHCRGGLGRAGTIAALLLIERGETADAAIAAVRAARPGAIETVAQDRFLKAQACVPNPRIQAIRAMLFGCAIGDSLGAEIEFMGLPEIRCRFPNGLTTIPPHDGRVGSITDDTQMTLFTAEGLSRAIIRQTDRGICGPTGVIGHALARWLATQGETPPRDICQMGLVADPRLHRRRAPGLTCLGALRRPNPEAAPVRNDSKGCGTIMRVAPLAVLNDAAQVARLAHQTSALTHGHPTGQDAAVAWALILHGLLAGGRLEDAARNARDHVGLETQTAIERACAAPRDGQPETVETLGGGWIAEEALAIALYACLCAPNPETGWRIAVTHSGDSDSTGAIAGAALGVLFPEAVMAHPWRQQVECADLIDRLARDLAWLTGPDMTSDVAIEPVTVSRELAQMLGKTEGDRVLMPKNRDPSEPEVATYHTLSARYPGW